MVYDTPEQVKKLDPIAQFSIHHLFTVRVANWKIHFITISQQYNFPKNFHYFQREKKC